MPNLTLRLALSVATALLAAQTPLPAQQVDPTALTAKDSHQGLLIAVNPDITADSSRAAFGKHTPYDAGILALDVYFRNDNNEPVHIDLSTVRLFFGASGEQRQKLEPLPPDTVADLALMLPDKDPTTTRRSPIPSAFPKSKGKDWNELDTLLRSKTMTRDVVPAHATVHGYLFFDIGHQFDSLSNGRLDIPDLSFTADNAALFFFQIELAPAVAPPNRQ
jgi:hypothetical protein